MMDIASMTRPMVREYVVALILVGSALGLSLISPAMAQTVPYALFFIAAVAVAARAGAGPGMFAIAVGALAAQYVIVSGGHRTSLITLAEFVMMSGIAVWGVSARHTSHVQLQKQRHLEKVAEDLRRENHELAGVTRSATHQLMQSLGAITNYAEVIRGHSTDSVRECAGKIIDVTTRAAANIRKQYDFGGATTKTPVDVAAKSHAESTPTDEDPSPRPASSLAVH